MEKKKSFKIYKSEFTIGHRRFIAAIIDFLTLCLPLFIYQTFISQIIKNQLINNILSMSLVGLFILFKDCIFKNGSIGKKIMQIAIYDKETNKYATNKIKIKRNLMILEDKHSFGSELINKNERSADIKYNTYVDLIKK